MPQISLSVRPREESGDSLHRREWQFDFWVTLSNDQFWFRGWNDRLESPLTLSNPTVFSVGYGRACLLSKAFVVQSESKLLIYWWYGTWVRAFWRRVWRNELASLKDVLLTHSQCASRRLSWARPWTGLHSTDKFAILCVQNSEKWKQWKCPSKGGCPPIHRVECCEARGSDAVDSCLWSKNLFKT